MKRLIIVLAALFALPASAQTVTFATPSTLAASLKAAGASCGNTVVIASDMTVPRVFDFNPACRVKLSVNPGVRVSMLWRDKTATSPAILGSWRNIARLDIEGGEWGAFRIDGVRNSTFSRMTFSGPAPSQQASLVLGGAQNVQLSDMAFHDAWKGLMLNGASDTTVSRASFTRMISDGFNVSGWRNVVFEDFVCADFLPPRVGDHPDCGQAYTAVGQTNVSGLTFRRFQAHVQWAQGGFVQDPGRIGLDRIVIEDADIVAGLPRGASIQDWKVTNSAMRRVKVSTWPGSPYQSTVMTTAGVARCEITVAPYGGKPGLVDATPCLPAVGP